MSEVVSYAQCTGRTRVDGRGGIEHEYVDGRGARYWLPQGRGTGACLSGLVAQMLGTAA